MSLQLIFHGGSQEVGRSCFEIRANGDRYLVDCGLKFHDRGYDYPAKVFESRALDGVFLSHAHMDHSGGLPFFEHYKMSCPIFCTKETQDIVKILLKDSLRITKIKHACAAFTKMDLKHVFADMSTVTFDGAHHFRKISYQYFNAGHIQGSAAIKFIVDGTHILYTGDYNTQQTALCEGAKPEDWGHVDILISEATYGLRDHPERDEVEKEFLAKVDETLKRGGRVLIPVFAVGRAQEILIVLAKKKWKVPIYVDGMVKKVTNATLRGKTPGTRNLQKLAALYKDVKRVKSEKQREAVADKPGIFVTTSGMLQGGPVMSYIKYWYDDPKSAVLLTGYQVQNTNGWHLDTEKTVLIDGIRKKAKCDVERFDFSAHLSRSEIEKTILQVKPKITIFMHGAPDAVQSLQEWANQHSRAYGPAVGDQIDVEDHANISHKRLYTADDGYEFPEEHQHGSTCTPAMYDDFEDDD
ncbi:MAG: MBL fold metallo-hydrolase [Candidatus Woesearchaeota archaeon]|nr:MBL fold metallo-hydrolase [Candidatus Woesearchaeota archaeon]